MRFCRALIAAFALALPAAHAAKPTPEAVATIVVFNENDPDSGELARYYAAQRGVPEENLVGLKCSANEQISREEFDRDIAGPLRAAFEKNQWWKLREADGPLGRVEASSIHFVALMRGIPLKISRLATPYEGDSTAGPPQIMAHNEAAVDSELAVLGVHTRHISGGLNNPYFRSYQRTRESGLASLLLVCRLDAPTPALVRRMIDDSLAAEQRGLSGIAYIDARGTKDPQLKEGDQWLLNAATTARRKGMPVVLDTGAGLYPHDYPMTHAAIYLGWYAEHVAGPFARADFRFEPGAVALHLHSFSGSTLRDPKRNWCAPLLAAGAAATVGNVYEPYLGFTPNLDVFFDRLRAGFTFAESCYMSQRLLSWMTTFVGDPLYRPFKNVEVSSIDAPADEWEAYRQGARVWFEQSPKAGEAALRKSATQFKSGAILEGLGLLQLSADRLDDAARTFEAAAAAYTEPADILRATIHEVFQLRTLKRRDEALELARKRIAQFPGAPGAG
ncbi:MAG: TIGR03790 family protein, partial [Chthoniobacteraceae bacterium]